MKKTIFAIALIVAGCGGSITPVSPSKKDGTGTIKISFEQLASNTRYLSTQSPELLTILGKTLTGAPISYLPECRYLTVEQFDDIQPSLARAHAILVRKEAQYADLAPTWILAGDAAGFNTTLISKSNGSAGSIETKYGPVSAKFTSDTSGLKFSAVFGQNFRQATLSNSAQKCMEANICKGKDSKAYISSVTYGSLLRVDMAESTIRVAAEGEVNKIASASIEISRENTSLSGGYIGSLSGKDASELLIPDLLTALKEGGHIAVGEKLREATKSFGIISVEITKAECNVQ